MLRSCSTLLFVCPEPGKRWKYWSFYGRLPNILRELLLGRLDDLESYLFEIGVTSRRLQTWVLVVEPRLGPVTALICTAWRPVAELDRVT